jgi:glycosyltransferase involved in cell wall biosynthesis
MFTMSSKLKILYLIDFWKATGGTERHLSYLLTHLDKNRFQPYVVVFDYEPNALVDQVRALGIEVLHMPVARYYTPNAFIKALELRRFIRARGIDIVQTFHYKADTYGALVARLSGVRHVVSSKRDAADYKNSFHLKLHHLAASLTDRYIAVSGVIADVIGRKEGVPADKFTVIHNGVDLGRYGQPSEADQAAAKVANGFAPDDFVIGMTANFRPEKDHQLLIDAFRELHREEPKARLLLVGGGPQYEQYKTWVQENGLADSIRLTGPVDDVRPFLHAVDVACLVPKINEGFSNSILEKMATGLPVIATDVGGNKEAIAEDVTGNIIAPRDGAALLDRLRRLRANRALRARMSAAARERAVDLFSLPAMIRKHTELYDSLSSRKRISA